MLPKVATSPGTFQYKTTGKGATVSPRHRELLWEDTTQYSVTATGYTNVTYFEIDEADSLYDAMLLVFVIDGESPPGGQLSVRIRDEDGAILNNYTYPAGTRQTVACRAAFYNRQKKTRTFYIDAYVTTGTGTIYSCQCYAAGQLQTARGWTGKYTTDAFKPIRTDSDGKVYVILTNPIFNVGSYHTGHDEIPANSSSTAVNISGHRGRLESLTFGTGDIYGELYVYIDNQIYWYSWGYSGGGGPVCAIIPAVLYEVGGRIPHFALTAYSTSLNYATITLVRPITFSNSLYIAHESGSGGGSSVSWGYYLYD